MREPAAGLSARCPRDDLATRDKAILDELSYGSVAMSKRLMFAVMTVIAGLALSACGNKGALVKPKPTATTTAPTPSNPATNPPAKPDPATTDKSH